MPIEQALLSDTQIGAILAVLGGIGTLLVGTLRWGIGRIVKAIDDSSAERARHTETLVKVETKIDHAVDRIDDMHDLLVDRPPRPRPSTPAMGSSGRARPLTADPERGIATVRLIAILAGGAVLACLIALACHNEPTAPPAIADVPVDHAAPACPATGPTYDCTTSPCIAICPGVECAGTRVICTVSSLPVCLCLPVGAPPGCP
jgi:hypothetical protein